MRSNHMNNFRFEYLDNKSGDVNKGYTYKWMQTTSDLLGFLTAAMVRDSVMTMPALQVTKDFIFNELNETCGRKISSDFKNGELTLDNIFVHSMLIDDIEMDKPDEYPYVILSFIDEDGEKVVVNDIDSRKKHRKTLDLNSDNFKRMYANASNKRLTQRPAYESKSSFDVGTYTFAEVNFRSQGKGMLARAEYRIVNVDIPKEFSSDLDCVKYVYACNMEDANHKEAAEYTMNDVQEIIYFREENHDLYNKYKKGTITFGDFINADEDGLFHDLERLETCDFDNYIAVPLTIVTPNKTCVTFIHDFGDTHNLASSCGYMMISDKRIDFPIWVQDTSDIIGYALVYAYYYINSKDIKGNKSLRRDEVLEKLKKCYIEFDSYAKSFETHTLSFEDRDIKCIFDALDKDLRIFSELCDK